MGLPSSEGSTGAGRSTSKMVYSQVVGRRPQVLTTGLSIGLLECPDGLAAKP